MSDPGKRNRRVTIRTATLTPDGGGGYTSTPHDVVTTDAHIEPLDGAEQIQAMQTGMQRPHRITMRYRPDLTGASEIVYQGRSFDVKSIVDTDMRHAELVVLADEVVP